MTHNSLKILFVVCIGDAEWRGHFLSLCMDKIALMFVRRSSLRNSATFLVVFLTNMKLVIAKSNMGDAT